MSQPKPRISFLAFFILWANRMGWDVPPLHVKVCVWLENKGPLALLMLPRGHAKSTILGIYNAWRYFCNPTLRILHQGESDKTAFKTARDTKSILERHPLTMNGIGHDIRGEISFWWLPGNDDERNPSMQAAGIMTNITSSRADEVQNDDVEVPKNIGSQEMREKMRFRLEEQIHISVPGATELYVGTPHTFDSLYSELQAEGADCFIARMFESEHRMLNVKSGKVPVPFFPDYIFSGIGKTGRILKINVDYQVEVKGGTINLILSEPFNLLDLYSKPAWPERFTRDEMERRRKRTRTINAWDSQYQLHAKPVIETRLDPARIVAYDVEPVIRDANNSESMWLGKEQIVGATVRWDPSSGKLKSDTSAVAVCLQAESGRRYLHKVDGLTGELAEFGNDGKTIVGGQVMQLCKILKKYNLPRVSVETNGIGGFAPTVLRACLKQLKIQCGVVDHVSTDNKNKRILETFEPLLMSRGMLWAHIEVLKSPFWNQMRDWNPATQNQKDDLLDAASGAISESPERFKGSGQNNATNSIDWRPNSGVYDVQFE